jgi:hypothetical protein
MPVPHPTPIYRFIHVDNLHIYLRRGEMHAPNHIPRDGLVYKTIHNVDIQSLRRATRIPCGPGGVIHDYVSFYFGYLSPMHLQLKTGKVEGYNEGQEPLIYIVSSVQMACNAKVHFVFADGHGIAAYTNWYDNLSDLDKVDWDMVYQRYWADTVDDMDRQRRKQAEFLMHRLCDWSMICEIGVINGIMKTRVENIMSQFSPELHRPVCIRGDWYY